MSSVTKNCLPWKRNTLTKYAATDFLQIRGQVLVYFQHFEMKVKRSVLLTKRFLFLLAGLVGVTVILQCSIFVLLSIYKIAGSCCFKMDEGTIRNQAKLSKWVVLGEKPLGAKERTNNKFARKKNGQKKLYLEIKDKFYSTKVVPAFLLGV